MGTRTSLADIAPGGALCVTVPIIVARMSCTRSGLADSWHGAPQSGVDDLRVHTEFGADTWTLPLAAGFGAVTIHAIDYQAGIALTCPTGS